MMDNGSSRASLQDGFTSVAPGRIATVVTHLEMSTRTPLRPAPPNIDLRLERHRAPALDWYRALYKAVGQEWLWFSRLSMPDAALAEILHHTGVEVYAVCQGAAEIGLLELDFREESACELAFFGLTPAHVGSGVGRWLMNRAIELAFAKPIQRFHVHTCTLDHPAALAFYMRSGFLPVRQEIEVAPDPRLTGVLPRTAAPRLPIVE